MGVRNRALVAAALVGVLGGVNAARASDWMTPVAADRWSGLYGGGALGYGTASAGGSFSGTLFGVSASGSVAPAGLTGFVGGGEFGVSRQFGSLVLGLEAGVLGADLSGSSQQSGSGTTITATTKIDLLATGRARAGVAFDRLLLYGAAGVASGYGKLTVVATGSTSGTARASQGLLGWSAGFGAQYAFSDRWSVGLDYQHIDIGSSVYSDPTNAPSGSATIDLKTDVVTGRVDYRF